MNYDWKALAPTRPLGTADILPGGLYVPRGGEGAFEIDALLNAGLEQPIALFGPAGVGKSTELAALASESGDTGLNVASEPVYTLTSNFAPLK